MNGGNYFYPLKREFLNLSGGTVTGDTIFLANLSANTIIYSGTNLSQIIFALNTGSTKVNQGINTFTAGTDTNVSINITGATLNYLYSSGNTYFFQASATTLSGGTIYSGNTELSTLFATPANITLSNLQLATKSNLSGATFTGNVTASNLSATTLSGNTIYSGTTELSTLFATSANIITTNAQLITKANLSGATFTGNVNTPFLSATTLSASTILSGSTDLNNIFTQGNGTVNNIPLWNASKALADSIITQTLTGITVNGSVNIVGDINVLGTASTFNTRIIQSEDNNILLNFSGSHVSAIGGGITVLSGQPSGDASVWATDINGNWSANTQINANNGLDVVGGLLKSGGTNLYSIFDPFGSGVQSLNQGSNIIIGGTSTVPVINLNTSPSINNLTFSGIATGLALSSVTLSATTHYSGSTDISTLFATPTNITLINSQLTTKANLSGATFTGVINGTSLSATTISGGTIYSGNTDLYAIFATSTSTNPTTVQPGSNITTGGTALSPVVNLIASPSINNLTISGIGNSNAFSATTLSGGTILSGATNLYSIFATIGSVGGNSTYVQPGTNITTGGTAGSPVINLTTSPSINNLTLSGVGNSNAFSATTLSGGTIYSGNTDVSILFVSPATTTLIASQLTTKSNLSGATFTGTINGTGISATTLSGGTILSGSTDIGTLFLTTTNQTKVQNGLNTYTGGTIVFPTINISAATLNTLTTSGLTNFFQSSATTLSGGTIYSGNTDVSTLFATPANITLTNSQLGTKANLSGATFTGNINTSSLSATTLSGKTIYSGSTDVGTLFVVTSQIPFMQNGTNIYTGGTATLPTVNISGGTFNNITASGNTILTSLTATTLSSSTITSGSLSATTISGGTLYSGSTNLYSIFLTTNDGNDITRVQPGTNTTTGGTANSPTINLVDSPSINALTTSGTTQINSNLTVTGNTSVQAFTATTFGATTMNAASLTTSSTVNAGGGFITTGNASLANIQQANNNAPLNIQTRGGSFQQIIFKSSGTTPLETMRLTSGGTVSIGRGLITGGEILEISGNTNIVGNLTANTVTATTLSATTFYSGSTDVSTLFATPANITSVNSQLSTKANLSGATFTGIINGTSLSATTLSGGTIYSGNTELSTLFSTPANITSINSQLGTKANLSGATFTGTINGTIISATTLSGGTILSGSTDVSSLFVAPAVTTSIISQLSTKANLSGATFTGAVNGTVISATTLSAATFYSGSTDISTLFATPANITSVNSQLGTKANLSGATFTGTINGTIISATTLSATTYYSGSTDISTLFVAPAVITSINSQLSTKANLSGATFTGTINGTGISATTFSGGTIYSSSTELSTLFATPANITLINSQLGTKANLSGATFTGTINGTGISATTLSGGTILSGSTNLYSIFATIGSGGAGSTTYVQPGTNITTGGTALVPTINLIASPSINNLTVSGIGSSNAFSATTLSGGTLYSGSTNLYSIFATSTTGNQTFVQPGTNITTGGTSVSPIVNLIASPSINNLTFSGTATGIALSATTLSGGTIYSGSTDVGVLLTNAINTAFYDAMIYNFVLMGT